ncbi:MFS transporter [Leptothoe sp. LEGE 181152]|nr:MFS transporter [Leptothoe sp. LEGE 181152]
MTLEDVNRPGFLAWLQDKSHLAQIALFLSVLIDTVSSSIVVPLIPFYAQNFNASPLMTTLVFSASAITGFMVTPVWGGLSDRFGRRPLLLTSMVVSGIACLWFGLLHSLWALFACNALIGAASGSGTVATAYIADVTSSDQRARGLGVLSAAYGCGIILGPTLGGFLVGSDSATSDFLTPALVAASLSALAVTFTFFVLPESLPKIHVEPEQTQLKSSAFNFTDYQTILKNPLTLTLIMGLVLIAFAGSSVQSVLGLWTGQELHWGPQSTSFLYVYWGGLAICIELGLINPLIKRFGESNLFIWGLFTYSIAMMLLPTSRSLLNILLSLSVICLGYSLCRVVAVSLLSQSVSARQQGKVFGLTDSAIALATIISPLLAGYMFTAWGTSWPFWVGPILIIVVSLLSVRIIMQSRVSVSCMQQRQQNLQQLFDILDYDQNGEIEAHDFQQMVNASAQVWRWKDDSKEYKTALSFWTGLGNTVQQLMDTNGDGRVSLDEWIEFMVKDLDFDLATAFTKFLDVNADGKICLEELKAFYYLYKTDEGIAEKTFESLDLDQDGYISPDEMSKTFKHFIYGETLESLQRKWLTGI